MTDIDISTEAVERLAHGIEYGEDNSRDYTATILRALAAERGNESERAELWKARAAEFKAKMLTHIAYADDIEDAWRKSEAALAEAREVLQAIMNRADNGELGSSKVQDMKRMASAYLTRTEPTR